MYLLDTTHCIDLLNATPYMANKIDELNNSIGIVISGG